MAGQRTGGILSLVAGGVQLTIEGSFTVQPHSFQRETTVGVNGPAGHKRSSIVPYFDGTCYYDGSFDLATLQNIEGKTSQLNLYNGRAFVLSGATQVGEIELDATEGTFPLRLEGTFCDEV